MRDVPSSAIFCSSLIIIIIIIVIIIIIIIIIMASLTWVLFVPAKGLVRGLPNSANLSNMFLLATK